MQINELFGDFNFWTINIDCNKIIKRDKNFSYLFSSANIFCNLLNYYLSKNQCNL